MRIFSTYIYIATHTHIKPEIIEWDMTLVHWCSGSHLLMPDSVLLWISPKNLATTSYWSEHSDEIHSQLYVCTMNIMCTMLYRQQHYTTLLASKHVPIGFQFGQLQMYTGALIGPFIVPYSSITACIPNIFRSISHFDLVDKSNHFLLGECLEMISSDYVGYVGLILLHLTAFI